MDKVIEELNRRVAESREDLLKFFFDIVAIPSMDSDIEAVGKRIGEEMTRLGFDKVYVDRYGSIVGKIGDSIRHAVG